jgi:hypothetical protein
VGQIVADLPIDGTAGTYIIWKQGGLIMKRILSGILVLGLFMVLLLVAAPKSYQVTGKVKALTDTVISVLKPNGEVWEIGRDASLSVSGGNLAVGAKVTVYYKMFAVSAEIKTK